MDVNAMLAGGPMGGDQQVGALIFRKEKSTMLIFFWDQQRGRTARPDVKRATASGRRMEYPVA